MRIKKLLLVSIIFFNKTYAQDVKNYQERKLILENQIANLWQPNNVLDGNLSSEVFIPFFINEKRNLINNGNNENTFIDNKNIFVRRNISGQEVNFFIDDINSNEDLNINKE